MTPGDVEQMFNVSDPAQNMAPGGPYIEDEPLPEDLPVPRVQLERVFQSVPPYIWIAGAIVVAGLIARR